MLTSNNEVNNLKINSILNLNKDFEINKTSSSLKFCILAEGKAHVYPRFHKISKWDIAAGHAILIAAGGSLKDLENNDYKYDYTDIKTKAFIAACDPNWEQLVKKGS